MQRKTSGSSPLQRGWQLVRRGLEWIGGHELSVLGAVLLTVVAAWAFVAIADEVLEGETQHIDERVVRWMRSEVDPSVPIGPGWLKESGRDLTALGGHWVVMLVVASVAGFLWLKRVYAAMWLVLASTLGGVVASLLLKLWFARERPSVVPHLTDVSSHSFPSGHSMLSAVVYLTLGALLARLVDERRLKAYFLLIALLLTFIVGLTRVYLGVHYPTDVLAGWSAGLVWACACWLVARWLQRRGAVEDEHAAL